MIKRKERNEELLCHEKSILQKEADAKQNVLFDRLWKKKKN